MDGFAGLNVSLYEKMHCNTLKCMRHLLLARGVFVKSSTGLKIEQNLTGFLSYTDRWPANADTTNKPQIRPEYLHRHLRTIQVDVHTPFLHTDRDLYTESIIMLQPNGMEANQLQHPDQTSPLKEIDYIK